MVTPDSKPAKLYDLFRSLESYHNLRLQNQSRWDRHYYQEVGWAQALVPKDVKVFRSSTATDVVDETADQIRTDEPVIRFTPRRDTQEGRKKASTLIQWASEQMDYDRRNAEIDPYSQSSKDEALRGEGVVKQLHNPDLPPKPIRSDFDSIEEYEEGIRKWEAEMGGHNVLLPARIVDPLNIFLPPNARSPLPYLIEYQKRTQADMWRDYPEWKTLFNGRVPGRKGQMSIKDMQNPARETDWLEYWSPEWYIIEVDGIRIVDKPNPYGFVPYWHEYSGLGRVDRNAGSDRKAIGILGKIEGEIEGDVMLRTISFAAATQYVFPRVLAPEDEVTRVRDSMAQRAVIPYSPQNGPDSIRWLESPELKPDVSNALAQIRDAISRRVSPSQSGVPTNAQSGVQEALRIGQSAKGQTDIVEAVNNLATGLVNIKCRMMHALDLDYTLENGTKLKGGDFLYPNFEVEFNAYDPVEDTRRQQNGLTLMRDRAITRKTFRSEYISRIVTDPDDEEIQEGFEAAWDAWLASPEFQMWAVQQHMGDEAQQAEETAAAASQTPSNGQPTPGAPSDARRTEDLALLEQLAPTTSLNSLNGAQQILNGGGNGTQV